MRFGSERFKQTMNAETGREIPETHGLTPEEATLAAAERGYTERYLREAGRRPDGGVNGSLEARARQMAAETVEKRRQALKEHRAARNAAAFNLIDRLNRWAAMVMVAGHVGAAAADGGRDASGDQIELVGTAPSYGGGPLTEAGREQAEAKLAESLDEHVRAARERRAANEAQRMPDVALTGLHPEATPERIHRLMRDGLPCGWADNIESVSFSPKKEEMPKAYGLGGEVQANASHETARTKITFYGVAKEYDLGENLDEVLCHEGAHANDWDYIPNLSDGQRDDIRQKVVSRLTAQDRYKSDYVESIRNADAATEVTIKATEYWAVTFEAYLGAPDPASVLPQADIKMIEDAIRLTDDHFDRDAAWQVRQTVIEEMQDTKVERELDGLIESLRLDREEAAELQSTLLARWAIRHAPTDAVSQRAGRKALVDLAGRFDDPREFWVLRTAMGQYKITDDLLKRIGEDRIEQAKKLIFTWKWNEDILATRELPGQISEIRRQVREIFERYGLRTGGTDGFKLPPGEYPELLAWGNDDPTVVTRAGGWEAAPEDRGLADFIETPTVEVTITARGKRPDRT